MGYSLRSKLQLNTAQKITHHSIYQRFLSANSPRITLLWFFFSLPLHPARTHLQGSSLTMRNTYSFHSKLLWFDIYLKAEMHKLPFFRGTKLKPRYIHFNVLHTQLQTKVLLISKYSTSTLLKQTISQKITHLLGFRSWRTVQIQDKVYLETFWLWNLLICGNSAYLYDFIHHLKSLQKSK